MGIGSKLALVVELMTQQMDLLGETTIPTQRQPVEEKRATTNDMDLIESVLRTAMDPGYVVIGGSQRVYRYHPTQKDEVERVPSYEDAAVHQLVDQKLLRIGGNRQVTYGQHEGGANSVLVAKAAQRMAARWRSYKRPESWGERRHP